MSAQKTSTRSRHSGSSSKRAHAHDSKSPQPGSVAKTVLAGLDQIRGWQEDLYRDLHQHPELSYQEHRTAAIMADHLQKWGYEVHSGVGKTGVVGILRNGDGPGVLLRSELDALPVEEQTGLPYGSTVRGTDPAGNDVPVMHACGHDAHMTCLLGAAELLAGAREHWNGTLVTVFQPAEELGSGAQSMVDDDLADLVGKVNVALTQHALPFPAGQVASRPGIMFSTADSMKVTVYGRGGHGSMPQDSVDPVVLAASIVLRLQTIVAREIAPTEPVVVSVGSIQAGTKSNVIDDHAVLLLNIRTYSEEVRTKVLDEVHRIVKAECEASESPRDPEFEMYDHFPITVNDKSTTDFVRSAFDAVFGDESKDLPLQTPSEDFSDIPDALGAPYTYWGLGCIDPDVYEKAEASGRIAQDVPVNHSALFAPVIQPTLDTGTKALVAASLAWLGHS
jgi:amidohydrolase